MAMTQTDFDQAYKDLHARVDALLQQVTSGGGAAAGPDLSYEVGQIRDLTSQIDAIIGSGPAPVQGGSTGPLPPVASAPTQDTGQVGVIPVTSQPAAPVQPVQPTPVQPVAPVQGSPFTQPAAQPVQTIPAGGQQPVTAPTAPVPDLPVG